MTKFFTIFALLCTTVMCDQTSNGIRASNVLGGADQHASFSFVRPGLTQTSYSFNGPSSHQSFSSSIGNPHLAHRVLPNVANALAYRNPGLGYFSTAPISTGYANSPYVHNAGVQANPASSPSSAFSYQQQAPLDQSTAQAYLNQYHYYQQQAREAAQAQFQQQQQQQQQYPEFSTYQQQSQLGQLLALRQQQQGQLQQLQANAAQQQNHGHTSQHVPVHETSQQQIPEQVQLQQQQVQQQDQQPSQSLLGVAYSSAPSVAHVKVSGNGYKFDF